MKSQLAKLFTARGAKPATPNVDELYDGAGDIRAALGVSDYPEDKPLAYFLFRNHDEHNYEGSHQAKFVREDDGFETEVSSTDADLTPTQSAFIIMNEGRTTSVKPEARGLAFVIDNNNKFDRLLLNASRAFRADTAHVGDLVMSVFYIPALTGNSPTEKLVSVTFAPDLAAVPHVERDKGYSKSAEDPIPLSSKAGKKAAAEASKVLAQFTL